MSLRAFHLLFIALSAALAVFMGAWASGQYRVEAHAGYLAVTVVSIGTAVGLAAYGMAFRRKTKGLS
jgi:hypothetical protein